MALLAITLTNLGLAGAITAAIWVTKSPWPLLAFCFMFQWKTDTPRPKKCPHCKAVYACPNPNCRNL